MRTGRVALALVVGAALAALAAGCGSPSAAAGRPSKNANLTLTLRTVPQLGTFLVAQGWTLYMYPPDQRKHVTCTKVEQCTTAWPPLYVTAGHTVTAGPGVSQQLISSDAGDGGRVVTYNGWPLYYYIGDRAEKNINGQGNGFNWYVVSPSGIPNKRSYRPQ